MTAVDSEHAVFRVVVLSGPSGSGKTTIVDRLVDEAPVRLVKAISATTRPPRIHEVDGRDYCFLTDEEFRRRKDNNEFVEVAEVFSSGYWYGTLRSELERARRAGGWAFLEIDVEGALKVMQEYPDAVTIFLTTPSDTDFEERLRARGTESEEAIQRRLATARKELAQADRYRYRVVNDDLDRTVREICDILERERERVVEPRLGGIAERSE
jgi:guanylate kinase